MFGIACLNVNEKVGYLEPNTIFWLGSEIYNCFGVYDIPIAILTSELISKFCGALFTNVESKSGLNLKLVRGFLSV